MGYDCQFLHLRCKQDPILSPILRTNAEKDWYPGKCLQSQHWEVETGRSLGLTGQPNPDYLMSSRAVIKSYLNRKSWWIALEEQYQCFPFTSVCIWVDTHLHTWTNTKHCISAFLAIHHIVLVGQWNNWESSNMWAAYLNNNTVQEMDFIIVSTEKLLTVSLNSCYHFCQQRISLSSYL